MEYNKRQSNTTGNKTKGKKQILCCRQMEEITSSGE